MKKFEPYFSDGKMCQKPVLFEWTKCNNCMKNEKWSNSSWLLLTYVLTIISRIPILLLLRWSTCVLVYFSWLLDHVIYLKLSKTHKVTTIFTQNYNFVHPGQFWLLCFEFAQLYITDILLSGWDKSRAPRANWSKLEHM